MANEPTIRRELIYDGKIIKVVKDDVSLKNQKTGIRELVFHHGAVGILPIKDNGEIVLVKQFRKALEESIWEIPAGKIENSDDDCLATAQRELEEEIQMVGDLEYLCDIYTAPGFCDEKISLYKATNLQTVKSPRLCDEDEELQVMSFPLDKLPEIKDAKTIIAIDYLIKEKLRRNE